MRQRKMPSCIDCCIRMNLLLLLLIDKTTAFHLTNPFPVRNGIRCRRNTGCISSFTISANRRRVQQLHASSPLLDYDAWIDNKLEYADTKSVFLSSSEDDESSWKLPMIDFLDLVELSLAASRSKECASKRQNLAQTIASHGGYCIIRLPHTDNQASERRVITSMWKSMYELFENKDTLDQKLRHQTLTRTDDVETNRNSGYKFIQTNLQDFAALSPVFRDAFILLSLLAKAFAVICYSAIHNPSDPAEATHRIDEVLNEDTTSEQEDDKGKIVRRPLAGTYHRLCRYVENTNECLRSHADWTCATSVPVSNVPGLEIYDAQIQAWIQPEKILAARSSSSSKNDIDHEHDNREHTKYIVVMSGKWLELLTGGVIPSCLHRVVGNAEAKTRFSAPLFLRPKESLFVQLENLRYEDEPKADASDKKQVFCAQFIASSLKHCSSTVSASISTSK